MFPTISTDTAGFVDDDSGVTGDRCDRDNAELVPDDEEGAGRLGGRPQAVRRSAAWRTRRSRACASCRPRSGDAKGHDFSVKVDVRDDCDVKKVEIKVMPQGLSAVAKAPPYEWELTGINGAQTITVTATDGSGRIGRATLEVTAPETREELGPEEDAGAGCNVASGAFGAAGAGAVAGDAAAVLPATTAAAAAAVTGALTQRRRADRVGRARLPSELRARRGPARCPRRRRSAHSSASSAMPSSSSGGADQISTDCWRPTRTSRDESNRDVAQLLEGVAAARGLRDLAQHLVARRDVVQLGAAGADDERLLGA